MPAWEDTTPYIAKQTRARRLSASNVFLFLNIVGFVLTGVFTRSAPDRLAFLEFDAHSAIGKLWLWQFVTFPFVHPMDVGFLFGFILAGYALYTLGNELEALIGPRRFLLYYFAFAAYGALAHSVFQYVDLHAPRAVSFLGPVYGLSLTAALRRPDRPTLFLFVLPLRTITCVLLMGIAALAYCAFYFPAGLAPIAGGALAAGAVALLEPRIDAWREGRATRRERERFFEEIELRGEVDRLLEKISREGMDRLTRAEKRALRKGSELLRRQRGISDG